MSAAYEQLALSALEQAPSPTSSYRVSGKVLPSALDAELARFVRIELLKSDLACLLALGAIAFAAVSSVLTSSAWDRVGALLVVLGGGFGVFRWRSLRRAIARAAEDAATAAAQRGVPES